MYKNACISDCDADRLAPSLSALNLDRITCNILVERDSKLLFNARTKKRVYAERNAVIAFAFSAAKMHTGCLMVILLLLLLPSILVHAFDSTKLNNERKQSSATNNKRCAT